MLQYFRLGHPKFSYLARLFPSLFQNNKDFSLLHCEFCELGNHTCVSFAPKPYTPSFSFSFIHNIWGPSQIPNCTGKKWFLTFIDDHIRVTWVYLLRHKSDASIFQISTTWLGFSYIHIYALFEPTMVNNTSIPFSVPILRTVGLYARVPVSILHNKMEYQKEKAVIS